MSKFSEIKVGDSVTRMIAGSVPMVLKVTEVDDFIHCGPWKFSKETGAEIDDEIGWDESTTGSYLKVAEAPAKLGLGLEPEGTIPTVGDYVVCFGDSAWRQIGKPYKVIEEEEFDVVTEDGSGGKGYWFKDRFKSTTPLNMPIGIATDMPRHYRVVKRGFLS